MKYRFFAIYLFFTFGLYASLPAALAQYAPNNPRARHANAFEPLGSLLPTPNEYRSASGAAGHAYFQQKADYDIDCVLDENTYTLYGEETITYYNNSPDVLMYLWLELSENQHHPTMNAGAEEASGLRVKKITSNKDLAPYEDARVRFAGMGMQIASVTQTNGAAIPYVINKTLMRVDIKQALAPKQKISFRVKWSYKIPERLKLENSRGGFEKFTDTTADKKPQTNALFTITQWYPRMCVYNDYAGWDLQQFTGKSEFSLGFGDFKVRIQVPADHIVAATGECKNYKEVLSEVQYDRWQRAQTATSPLEIVRLEEALSASQTRANTKKIWHYEAKNVRDFAWTSSRRFAWDAMAAQIEGKKVMCMSLYGKEAYPLFSKYSTKTIAHTLSSYSHYSIPYPYPVAISVEAANGMEYPMICFNYGRVDKNGKYSEAVKNGMISVVIHEIGHNFFPMIINNNERRWSWLDEGVNSFFEFLTEQSFDHNFPSRRGPAPTITNYMRSPAQALEPIMTSPEQIKQFGNNIYGKTAAALNILRETVLGRALFDKAFRTYAERWAFKSPTPADFFRSMEDASGQDLSWFWRTWFFETKPVDIALDSIYVYVGKTKERDSLDKLQNITRTRDHITRTRDIISGLPALVDTDASLRDAYNPRVGGVEGAPKAVLSEIENKLVPKNFTPLDSAGRYAYELFFTNKGGAISPIIIEWTFAGGEKEIQTLAAEAWRYDERFFHKVFIKKKPIIAVRLDPRKETADIDEANNICPAQRIFQRTILVK